MPPIFAKLCLAMVAVAVAISGTQAWVSLAHPEIESKLLPFSFDEEDVARLQSGDTYIQFDAELGWTVAPSVTAFADGVTYQSNAQGFRARREYRPGRSSRVRLAAFGDSFTHCDEVEFDECWTDQLERDWRDIEVLNFGVPGYAPDQALLAYRRRAAEFQPCGVLIGFMVENVNRVVNRYRPFYEPETGIRLSKPRFLLEDGQLRLLPNPATSPADLADPRWVEANLSQDDYWYYPGMFAGSVFDTLLPVRLARTALYRARQRQPQFSADDTEQLAWTYANHAEGFQVASRLLVEFAREVERDGRSPVVVIFGRKDDIVAQRQRRDPIYEPLVDVLKAERVPTIDVTPTLGRVAREIGTLPLVDKHYRKRGHAEVGRLLARELPPLVKGTCS